MKCKHCIYGVFNEKWGEYKCKKLYISVPSADHCEKCEYYEEKKGQK